MPAFAYVPLLFEKYSPATPVPASDDAYDHCTLAPLSVESPTQHREPAANERGDTRDTVQTLAVSVRLESLTVPIVAKRLRGDRGTVPSLVL